MCPFNSIKSTYTVLQRFRRIELIAHISISVLPCTNFYLSQVMYLRGRHTIEKMAHGWERWNMIGIWNPAPSRVRNHTTASHIYRASRSSQCATSLSESGWFLMVVLCYFVTISTGRSDGGMNWVESWPCIYVISSPSVQAEMMVWWSGLNP